MIIDTHAHLDFKDYDSDLSDVLLNAGKIGVESIINVGIDFESSRKSLELRKKVNEGRDKNIPELFASIGIHPNNATGTVDDEFEKLKNLLNGKDVVAIGETGLDYYRDHSLPADQQKLFRKHIELSISTGLPLIIHCREANDDCLRILKEYSQREIRGVIHCFSSDKIYARKFLDSGFYISFTGPVTYPKANELREAVKFVPTNRLLLETDSPFLAPQKKRGQRNEPSFLQYVIPLLAEIYCLSTDDIERVTTVNAKTLFRLQKDKLEGEIAYAIRDSLYLNITGKCTNRCRFCERETDPYVKGHYLGLSKEPSFGDIIDAICSMGPIDKFDEVVFCGFGESTMRLEMMKTVSVYLRNKGVVKIRLDTNGLGDLVNPNSVCSELKGLIDHVCISLNTNSSEQYEELCRPEFGAKSYGSLIMFIKDAKQTFPKVTVSVVDMPGIDVEACRKIAADLGVNFRLRKFDDTGYKND